MSPEISRRDFLKLASVGAATTAALTGCGPASRYVTREPYVKMPEYNYNGLSTYYATTCRECSAGCGLVIRTFQGRALKVEGNRDHPVNMGKTCPRGQITLQGLYNPDRVTDPLHRKQRGSNDGEKMDWDAAVQVVTDALTHNQPNEVAFLLGMTPDHLFDMVSDMTKAMGAPAPIRYGAPAMFESRATLVQAAQTVFGQAALPSFDIGGADLVVSFGANFLEPWLSQVSQTRGYRNLRQGTPNHRGLFVQFESRMSQTASKADEWIPNKPGTEAVLALAMGRIIAEARGLPLPPAFATADVNQAASQADINADDLKRLATILGNAQRPLVIPGGQALAQSNGLQTAQAILSLNAFLGNLGKAGGVYLSPIAPLEDAYHRPASAKEMADFVGTLKKGAVKVLFVHGVNPLFELPKSLSFADALKNVPQVISFATFPDETALEADYVFPDHHGLESWGYQKVATGSNASVLSGAQPVVSPFHNTKATVDLLLAASQAAGGQIASALPFKDELEYIQSKLSTMLSNANGFFTAPEINSFTAYFQQHGGWWSTGDDRLAPTAADALNANIGASVSQFDGDGEFFLLPFVSPTLAEGGANKPWLQELGDPTTTVMWNTWIEMNPQKADEMGIQDNDIVTIVSPFGALEAPVYRYPAIRPDTIAIPFGQGHTAYGQFAAKRGVNPVDLLPQKYNEAGDLAYAGVKVHVQKTGRARKLSKMEGVLGVYGFDAKQ
ncbi:MAG TPA: molybdopterin-dependent oxidoreductase [Anaerolineales bacterium]|nr:molybdopterin-dependent oxidoreductase [Anaerolineales bacterium]